MPIYEFRCKGCGKRFEVRLSSADTSSVHCPECGSPELSRLMSLFFSPKIGQNIAVVGCDRCGESSPPPFCAPGSCPIQD